MANKSTRVIVSTHQKIRYSNYFVALCDILGFKDLVRNTNLSVLVEQHLAWFRKALNHSIIRGEFPEITPPTTELDSHVHIGVVWFSDTILLYSREDTDDAIREVLTAVAWLIFETMVQGKTRIRAGIAYGEAFIDPENSLFVGQPIIDAYDLEKKQQWSGAALTKSAVDRLPEAVRSGKYADWWVTPYEVPLKKEATLATLAVNWSQGLHPPSWRFKWSKNSDLPAPSDWDAQHDICEKFVNTKIFHEKYCHQCRSTDRK